ncbi:MAG: prephenate dehydrogenase [Hadesarchaea archaeon]|nr:prephenate dehydrogenase [Hadesarchaea archaeon]
MDFGVIGVGLMGKWFAEYAKNKNWSVKITDIDNEKAKEIGEEIEVEVIDTNEELASESDIVLVAVPVKKTPKVIREIHNSMKKDALLVDLASAKEDVVDEMKKLDERTELASIHPLFGPGAEDAKDKIILSVPVNTGDKYDELKKSFEDSGAKFEEMGAEKHDKLMMVTQSLTHFTLLTYISALKSMGGFEEVREIKTPISSHLLEVAKAFLNTNPELCGNLQIENRYAPMARSSVMEACRSLNVAMEANNINAVKDLFKEARELIGSEEIEEAYKKLYDDIEEEK